MNFFTRYSRGARRALTGGLCAALSAATLAAGAELSSTVTRQPLAGVDSRLLTEGRSVLLDLQQALGASRSAAA